MKIQIVKTNFFKIFFILSSSFFFIFWTSVKKKYINNYKYCKHRCKTLVNKKYVPIQMLNSILQLHIIILTIIQNIFKLGPNISSKDVCIIILFLVGNISIKKTRINVVTKFDKHWRYIVNIKCFVLTKFFCEHLFNINIYIHIVTLYT